MRVCGTWADHPLVEARQKSDRLGRSSSEQLIAVVFENKQSLAVDRDLCQAILEAGEPAVDALATGAQAVSEPVLNVVGCRRAIRPEIGLDCAWPSLVEVRNASPPGVVTQALIRGAPVSRRAETHRSLP